VAPVGLVGEAIRMQAPEALERLPALLRDRLELGLRVLQALFDRRQVAGDVVGSGSRLVA
jgi:hypothetical protein